MVQEGEGQRLQRRERARQRAREQAVFANVHETQETLTRPSAAFSSAYVSLCVRIIFDVCVCISPFVLAPLNKRSIQLYTHCDALKTAYYIHIVMRLKLLATAFVSVGMSLGRAYAGCAGGGCHALSEVGGKCIHGREVDDMTERLMKCDLCSTHLII